MELSTLRAEIGREWLDATRNVHDSSSTAAQLLWMSEHEPASLERTKEIVLGAPGFLRRRSTGEQVSDLTTASTAGLLDITTATWWRLMLPGCDHSTADELAAAAGPTSSCSRRWPGSGHPGGTPPHAAP